MGLTTIGRVGESGIYIGRGSKFGNPYRIGKDGTREEVIEKFRVYFYKRLNADPVFLQDVADLQGCHLLCYCKPEACHGDVIAEYLNKGRKA